MNSNHKIFLSLALSGILIIAPALNSRAATSDDNISKTGLFIAIGGIAVFSVVTILSFNVIRKKSKEKPLKSRYRKRLIRIARKWNYKRPKQLSTGLSLMERDALVMELGKAKRRLKYDYPQLNPQRRNQFAESWVADSVIQLGQLRKENQVRGVWPNIKKSVREKHESYWNKSK